MIDSFQQVYKYIQGLVLCKATFTEETLCVCVLSRVWRRWRGVVMQGRHVIIQADRSSLG
jgi:hypothetical protein